MAKFKLQLSSKKSIMIDTKAKYMKYWLFYLLDLIAGVTTVVALVMIARNSVTDSYTFSTYPYVDLFNIAMIWLMILLAVQFSKFMLGGMKFFPESKFDLIYLLCAIGFISTLLVKQIFDLSGNDGMLPVEQVWHYNILGILMLVALAYLVDVIFRQRINAKYVLLAFAGLFEVAVLADYVFYGREIDPVPAAVILILAPVFYTVVFEVKSNLFKLALLLNALMIFLFGALTLDIVFTAVFALSMLLFVLYLAWQRELTVKSFKSLITELRKFKKFKLEKNLLNVFNWSLVLVTLVTVIVLGALLAFSDNDFVVIKNALESDFEVIKNAENVTEFLIGENLKLTEPAGFANFFLSYGLVGVLLVLSLFVVAIEQARRLAKRLKTKAKVSTWYYMSVGLLIVSMFIPLLFFIANFSVQMFLVYFLMLAVIANSSVLMDKKEQVYRLAVAKFKDARVTKIFAISRYLLIVGVLVLAIYVSLNIEDIFIGSTI